MTNEMQTPGYHFINDETDTIQKNKTFLAKYKKKSQH